MRFFLIFLATLSLAAPNAWGCFVRDFIDGRAFEEGSAMKEKAEKRANDTFEKADYIAMLRILKADNGIAIVQRLRTYKGKLPEIFQISYPQVSSACGHDFLPGQKALLILSENKQSLLAADSPSTLIFSRKLGLEALERLSREHTENPVNKDKEYKTGVIGDLFITKLSERALEEKKERTQPISDKKYISLVTDIIKGCKALEKKSPLPPIQNPFYIDFEYSSPTTYSFSGKEVNIVSIWMPFYIQNLSKLVWPAEIWQNRFLEPVVVTQDDEIYTLTGCNFPDPSAFFEPETPAE